MKHHEASVDDLVKFNDKGEREWGSRFPHYLNRLFKIVRVDEEFVGIVPLVVTKDFYGTTWVTSQYGGGFYADQLDKVVI